MAEKIIINRQKLTNEEQMEQNDFIIGLIRELARLNDKINPIFKANNASNSKLVFEGIEDERDSLIDAILSDYDIVSFMDREKRKLNDHYKSYSKNIDFDIIVDMIMRILLKNFTLYDDIRNPKGFLISYCFEKSFGIIDNRVRSYWCSNRDKFLEYKSIISFDTILEKNEVIDMQDYLEDSDYSVNYFEDTNEKSKKDGYYRVNNIKVQETVLPTNANIKRIDKNKEGQDIKVVDIYADDYNYIEYVAPNDFYINKYYVNELNLHNEPKNLIKSTDDFNKELLNKNRWQYHKWLLYRAETGYIPSDIFKLKKGIFHIEARKKKVPKKCNGEKKSALMTITCETKPLDLDNIVIYNSSENYIKYLIDKSLSEKQKILIEYLYFYMMPAEKVVEKLGYKDKNALDKEKCRALNELKKQLIKDKEFIINRYADQDSIKLPYWVKKIDIKVNAKKQENFLSNM